MRINMLLKLGESKPTIYANMRIGEAKRLAKNYTRAYGTKVRIDKLTYATFEKTPCIIIVDNGNVLAALYNAGLDTKGLMMFTITQGEFTQTVKTIESVVRILVNCGVPKRAAKVTAIQIDYDEIWTLSPKNRQDVTIQKG